MGWSKRERERERERGHTNYVVWIYGSMFIEESHNGYIFIIWSSVFQRTLSRVHV